MGFEEPMIGLSKLKQPLSLMSASVHFTSFGHDGFAPKMCSGAMISDNGEMLTASHCFDKCRFRPDGSRHKNSDHCVIRINGVDQQVEIIQAANCNMEAALGYRYNKAHKIRPVKVPKECQEGDVPDFALVRLTNTDLVGDYSCLSISGEKTKIGQGVFTIGFPSTTTRKDPDNRNAPGTSVMQVSSGSVVNQAKCRRLIQPKTEFEGRFIGDRATEDVALTTKEMAGASFIQTTVDIVPGSSGGPLINSKGEIVGVASFLDGEVHGNDRECQGATYFQPTAGINQKFGAKLSDCEARKAGKRRSI